MGEIERLKEQWEREAEKERKKAQNQMADLEARLKKAEENGKKKVAALLFVDLLSRAIFNLRLLL